MAKVRCKNAKGTKLVEGHLYDVSYVSSRKLHIVGGSTYDIYRFETIDGSDISQLKISRAKLEFIDETDLNKWVKCINDRGSVQLTEGQLYKVIDINIRKGEKREYLDSVKLEGITGNMMPYRFVKPDEIDMRSIKIKKANGIPIKKKIGRKFDRMTPEERSCIMLRLISEAMSQKTKFKYECSVSELIMKNNKYNLTQEDIDEFGKLQISYFLNN